MSTKQTYEYILQIRESHLDTFGHVNNAVYVQLFEEARWELIHQRGYGLNKVLETQKGPIILGIEIKFKREVLYRENVKILSSFTRGKGSLLQIHQEMRNEKNEVCAEAEITSAFFDLKLRKLIDPTPEWAVVIS